LGVFWFIADWRQRAIPLLQLLPTILLLCSCRIQAAAFCAEPHHLNNHPIHHSNLLNILIPALPKFFRSQFEHPLFGKKPLSLLTSSALLSFKALNGFLHALIDDSETRIILIFCTQLLVLIVTALGYGDVKSKFVFASQVFGQIVKSVLYGLLCVEVVLSDRIRENSVFIVWLANNMFFLVLVGFACVLCPIILKIFVEVFRRKLSKKKHNSIKVFPKAIQKINRKRSIEKER
jgi:hypothetical protein